MNSPDGGLVEDVTQSSSRVLQSDWMYWRMKWTLSPTLVFPDQVLDDVLSEGVEFIDHRPPTMQLGNLDQDALRCFSSKSTALYFQGEAWVCKYLIKAMYEQWLSKLTILKKEPYRDPFNYSPALPVCLQSTGNHELFSSTAALIRLHKTITAQHKSLEEPAVPDTVPPTRPEWFRLRPAFEKGFIAADVRQWREFKEHNPGPSGSLELEVQMVWRLSMLPDNVEEDDFQYVENPGNGAETWVKRTMSLEDALEMVLRGDSILAEDTSDAGS